MFGLRFNPRYHRRRIPLAQIETAMITARQLALRADGRAWLQPVTIIHGEIYATELRAERVFAPGRKFVLDLTTADDEPLVPPAEIPPTADAAADGPAAETTPGEASPASADPPAEDLPAAA